MQNRITQGLMALILASGLSSVAIVKAAEKPNAKDEAKQENKAQKVTLAELPVAGRATIDKEIPGANIEMIDKEDADGKLVYDVEAKLKGKHVELDIAGDGKVLTREDSVPLASLPAAVRAAVEKYFGGPGDYEASKEVEKGKTLYEVDGTKDGKKVGLRLTEDGKQVEEEKQTEKE